ncbi:MAG: PilZ domain-containing protein [Hyphomicrobium aestuarii]|nr:PilZ domain-containing protein [Hyphomicrobium aestuarii]
MSHPPSTADRRRFGRKPCRAKAMIKAARLEPVPCIVLDYSDGGARIEMDTSVKLPAQFDLCFDDINLVVPCNLRHAFGRSVGIEFAEQPGRRSLSSAFGTEKLLAWLAKEQRPATTANLALCLLHSPAGARPALNSAGSPPRAPSHPLRCSLYTKAVMAEPAKLADVVAPPTNANPAQAGPIIANAASPPPALLPVPATTLTLQLIQ